MLIIWILGDFTIISPSQNSTILPRGMMINTQMVFFRPLLSIPSLQKLGHMAVFQHSNNPKHTSRELKLDGQRTAKNLSKPKTN